jgi:segregation and condensation protein B
MSKKSDKEIEADENIEVEASELVEDAARAAAELSDLSEIFDLEFQETEDSEELNPSAHSELESFQSAEIEEVEELNLELTMGIVEALLFATDRPVSVMGLKAAFQGTNIRAKDIREALEKLQLEYANPLRGVTLEEVANGFQLRTKPEYMRYLKQTVKERPFKLSGQALEVLSIVAYKQPVIKSTIDEIRGVESGHLMRGLLDRGLIRFAGKSELPGRPMLYETTKKFLEVFGLRNLQELPTLNEIDQLIPEGIGLPEEKKETLSELTGQLSKEAGVTYSEGEEELQSITQELGQIATTTDFFEAEKERQKQERDNERARDIRERQLVGEEVSDSDLKWLTRFEAKNGSNEPETPPAQV